MQHTWFRLYAEFATDPKVQMMGEADQRRYIMLLCLRCSNGDVTLHDAEIAFQLRVTDGEWTESKALFISKGLIDKNNNIVAWDKRQFITDSSAERVARHREKKKLACNVTVTPPDTDTDTESSNPGGLLVVGKPTTDCPHQEILALYAKHLPELPYPRIWDGGRAKNLLARWKWVIADLKSKGKAHEKSDVLNFFDRLFAYVARSDFLSGRSGAWTACDLGWIVKAENFAKVIEGKYENREAA